MFLNFAVENVFLFTTKISARHFGSKFHSVLTTGFEPFISRSSLHPKNAQPTFWNPALNPEENWKQYVWWISYLSVNSQHVENLIFKVQSAVSWKWISKIQSLTSWKPGVPLSVAANQWRGFMGILHCDWLPPKVGQNWRRGRLIRGYRLISRMSHRVT